MWQTAVWGHAEEKRNDNINDSNNDMVYFWKTLRDMLGCMSRRYTVIAQPIEQHG